MATIALGGGRISSNLGGGDEADESVGPGGVGATQSANPPHLTYCSSRSQNYLTLTPKIL